MSRPQGFAVMDKALSRRIQRKGGKTVQKLGVGHKWSKDEARAAGRKGGLASQAKARQRKREEETEETS